MPRILYSFVDNIVGKKTKKASLGSSNYIKQEHQYICESCLADDCFSCDAVTQCRRVIKNVGQTRIPRKRICICDCFGVKKRDPLVWHRAAGESDKRGQHRAIPPSPKKHQKLRMRRD